MRDAEYYKKINIMPYTEIMEILNQFGRLKGHVWLFNSTKRQRVLLERDEYRRYYMSQINGDTMVRVPQDVFESNVMFLQDKEFYLCF